MTTYNRIAISEIQITPKVLKAMVYAFASDGGLLDTIVKRNERGVFHGDINAENLVWGGGDNPIGIIDWGESSFTELQEQPCSCRYNNPMVSLVFSADFRKYMSAHQCNMEAKGLIQKKGEGEEPTTETLETSTKIHDLTNVHISKYLTRELVKYKRKSSHGSYFAIHEGMVRNITSLYPYDDTKKYTHEYEEGWCTLNLYTDGPFREDMDAQLYLSILHQQIMELWGWTIPGNLLGGVEFWNDVYKYNVDIWGAMTTFNLMLTPDDDVAYGDLELFGKMLCHVFVDTDSQTHRIDVEVLKEELLEYGDSIKLL